MVLIFDVNGSEVLTKKDKNAQNLKYQVKKKVFMTYFDADVVKLTSKQS